MISSPSPSVRPSTLAPLTKTPFRLRSSSRRTPSGWRTIRAWRLETVGSSKGTSGGRRRRVRVAPGQSVAPGDGGVVEADVGGQAAADPGPFPRQRDGAQLACFFVTDV